MRDEAIRTGTDAFLYKRSSELGRLAPFVAMQAESIQKFRDKLPNLFNSGGLITKRSLEQCSSEDLADYKASCFKGDKILILAAGLGMDDIAFAGSYKQVIAIDNDGFLNEIARYNYACMRYGNISRLEIDAEHFVESAKERYDMIYIDPDRRDEHKRQILLRDHRPNVIELMPKLLEISDKILIKCSPMYDHEMALRELKNISEIHCVSRSGEVKEMLVLVKKGFEGDVSYHCADIDQKGTRAVHFNSDTCDHPGESKSDDAYLYEAGATLIKLRLHQRYAAEKKLNATDPAVAFYTSGLLIDDFIGRRFSIQKRMPFSASEVKRYLASIGIDKANVKVRGLKFSTADAVKKLGLKDGGNEFLFILPEGKKQILYHCRALNPIP